MKVRCLRQAKIKKTGAALPKSPIWTIVILVLGDYKPEMPQLFLLWINGPISDLNRLVLDYYC